MNIYIDCEFNEFRGDLISMALVDEAGREFYEVLPCAAPGPWVAENVMPILGKPPVERGAFLLSLCQWLSAYDAIHVIADWPEDIAHFCQALIAGPGLRINTPPLTMEVRRDLDAVSELPHNALADARAIRLLAISRAALAAQPAQEAVAWQDPATLDVITNERKAEWIASYGAGGQMKAAPYTIRLVYAAPEPAQAPTAEAVAWCCLTANGQIAYFDGKPMVMPGPVGNECHPVPLYAAPQPAPAAAPTQEVERVTPEQLQALKRGLHTGKIIPPAAPAPAAGDELTHAELDGGDLPCPRCNGSGFDIVMSDNGPDAYETEVNCDHCDGRGSLGAAYTHLAQTLKRERERNKAAGNELHWHKSGPFWGYRADKSIQTVADRLDELADACSKYDARSERASDLRAAATIWRKHLAGPAEEQSPGGEDAA